MTKQTKTIFILSAIASLVVVAFNTLSSFFCGVGIAFVALIVLLALHLSISLKDDTAKARTKDLFYLSTAFCILEFIIYFIFEYRVGSIGARRVFAGIQNVFSFLGLFYFAYIAFRYIMEEKQKKVPFIELILGNKKIERKQKKAKEFSNGSLSEKPNHTEPSTLDTSLEQPETILPGQTKIDDLTTNPKDEI